MAAAARVATAPRESIALSERALALVRGLPEHSLIDRLVRGRAWIPVLGVLLAGIVAMQVEILKLGSSMGRSLKRASVLQTQNESLRANVAGLADDQRIERLAAGMGMSMPRPDSLVFLQAGSGAGVNRALANIHVPDPTGFVAQLAAQAAAAAALMPPAPASTPGSATAASPGATAGTTTSAAPTSTVTSTSSAAPTTSVTPPAPATAVTVAPATTVAPTSTGAPVTTAGPSAPAPSSSAAAGGVAVAPQPGATTGG